MFVVILAGSNRKNASSTKLAKAVGRRICAAGHEVGLVDLAVTPVPLYSPDVDYSGDPSVVHLKDTFRRADAIVLATPEYHGSISGVLKNALDYLGFDYFDGKTVLALSTAGGPVGIHSLTHIQTIVRNLHGINCPEWISLGGHQQEFDTNGELTDTKSQLRVNQTTDYFVELAQKLLKK